MAKEEINHGRRKFLVTSTSLIGGVGAVAAAVPFAAAWMPSARAEAAGAPVEVDISKLSPGKMVTVEWRGKPVWIIARTDEQVKELSTAKTPLRDPDSKVDAQPEYARNNTRSIKPEYLVLVGVCTHLGCTPAYRPEIGSLGSDWPGGFFCPCHGSKFDLAGRVYTGVPAPINLEVPPHYFMSNSVVLVGKDEPRKG